MTPAERRAVTAAAAAAAAGEPISLADRSFWERHGNPSPGRRRELLIRAAALENASAQLGSGISTGVLADLFEGSDYPASAGLGGPAETPQARVFVKVALETATGGIAYKSVAVSASWNSLNADVVQQVLDDAGALEGRYGLSNAVVLWESLLVY